MNLLGHAHVALAHGDDDPDWILGAVLPDLASMARARVDRSRLAPAVARGVACHHRADAEFHSQPAFVSGAGRIRQSLLDRGLASGTARAVGHVGWELLLDGTLVGSPAEAAYRRAMRGAEAVTVALHPEQRWTWLLGYRDELQDLRYDDVEVVAGRIHRMLERRPRLSFPAEQVPLVAEALHDSTAEVAAAAAGVLDAVARAV